MLIRMTRYLASGRRFVYADAILNLVLIHCLGMQLCFAFSVHLPMSDDGSLDAHDVRSAAERFDHSPFQIHKRQNSKTATCTCTCETRPEDNYNEEQVQGPEEVASPWNDNKIPVHDISGKPADEPADEPIAKPLAAAPATARPLPGHPVEVPDHSLNKLTADKVSELEAADKFEGSWGHGSRFPWKNLPDRMCYREPCTSDRDCCLRFNICDRSAHVCVDCWYGSSCMTDRDCCSKYPHCRPPQLSTDKEIGRCIGINWRTLLNGRSLLRQ